MIPVSFAPMILKMVLGKTIFPKLLEEIATNISKMYKLPQVVNYMELPNEADRRLDKMESQIEMIAKDQHPPKDFDERIKKLEEFEKQVRRKKAFKRKDG